MSKKIRRKECDSDTDAGTTDRSLENDYSQGSVKTILLSSGNDFDCDSSISTLPSTCSSPYRNFSSTEDLNTQPAEDSGTSSSYLDQSPTSIEQHSPLQQQMTPQTNLPQSIQHQNRSKRGNSAPAAIIRKLSARNTVKKLQIIEEHEECCSSDSSRRNRSEKKPKQEIQVTPRSIEVPPKKMCIRQKTPEMSETPEVPEELALHIGERWNDGANKRFSIGDREFILRKINKSNMTCASTQTKNAANSTFVADDLRLDGGDNSNVEQIREDQGSFGMNLPQSVEDVGLNPVALEPNIIVIGSDDGKKGRKFRKTKVGAAGDKDQKKKTMDTFTAMTPNSSKASKVCTPTYMMTANYYDASLQGRKFDLEPERSRSKTELIEREIKTIEPDSDSRELMNAAGPSENLFEMVDVKSYKSLLANYSSGVKPTRISPIHFDDLETLESKDEDPESMKFKEKASEWLRIASNQMRQMKPRSGNLREDQKNASIIDLRKSQRTNLDYYLVGSSSESSKVCSEDEAQPPSPGVKASEIYVDSDEGERCCNCFSALRLL